ncbi:phosphotransferase [Lentzea sp. NPDC051213]|uniref:phosphotransferase n=1 Tax=Lentzea sp. NPDC051213 TaxID=3364126 RepID=UPI0037A369D8
MAERSIIALVSAPSGFLGRTKKVLPVEGMWWYEAEPVNEALESLLHVPTTVLRMVSATSAEPGRGGEVTYHVEALLEPHRKHLRHLRPAEEPEADAPRRLPWARLGGPSELVAWADTKIERTRRAVQVKTWNQSSVHRLHTTSGTLWLKAVAPHLQDEATVIKMVAAHDPSLVPEVIASAPHRVLLGDAPGSDCSMVKPEHIDLIVPRWVAVQHALAGSGAPGMRPSAVPMPSFGLPDTVVHGEFSPHNWMANGMILDWSDAMWGNPALDVGRLLDYCRHTMYDHVAKVWSDAWLRHRPDSRPLDALDAARRASRLQSAVKSQEAFDEAEDYQRIYQQDGPPSALRSVRRLVTTP